MSLNNIKKELADFINDIANDSIIYKENIHNE